MNNMSLCASVLILLLCQQAIAEEDSLQPKAVISGPREAITGELIRLHADESLADRYHWLVDTSGVNLPATVDQSGSQALAQQLSASGWTVVAPASDHSTLYEIRDGGSEVFLSSHPGVYRVVLAVSIDGVGIDQTAWTVIVRSRDNPDSDDDPPDDPPEEPGPTPDQFTELVHSWLRRVPADSRGQIGVLVEVIGGTAIDFHEGDYETIAEMAAGLGALLKLSGINYQDWLKFLKPLEEEFVRLQQAGEVTTAEEFAEFLDRVAKAMEEFDG